MPIAVGNGSRVAQVSGNRNTKLEEPAPYALVGNIQTPLRKKILHIPIAQSEPGVEPNGMSNDFRWKAVTFEGDGVHPKRLHRNHQIEIRALNVTMPLSGCFVKALPCENEPQSTIVTATSSTRTPMNSTKKRSMSGLSGGNVRRGELYRVARPPARDPKRFRVFVVVSRQALIDSRFSTIICAPVYSTRHGLATQVDVGLNEGLRHDSSVHCDELVSLRKSQLTQFVGTFDTTKLKCH